MSGVVGVHAEFRRLRAHQPPDFKTCHSSLYLCLPGATPSHSGELLTRETPTRIRVLLRKKYLPFLGTCGSKRVWNWNWCHDRAGESLHFKTARGGGVLRFRRKKSGLRIAFKFYLFCAPFFHKHSKRTVLSSFILPPSSLSCISVHCSPAPAAP